MIKNFNISMGNSQRDFEKNEGGRSFIQNDGIRMISIQVSVLISNFFDEIISNLYDLVPSK